MHLHRFLTVDPAWPFKDKLPGETRGAARNYRTQTISEIMRMELPPLDDDCVLALWRVASMQQEALDVIKAYGFRPPEREVVWLKKTVHGRRWFGMGHVVRAEHEICLIAIKGHPRVKNHSTRSTFVTEEPLIELAPDLAGFSARVPQYVNANGKLRYKHSQKPEVFFDICEGMFEGPYAETNARRQRPGWTCVGDEMPSPADEINAAIGGVPVAGVYGLGERYPGPPELLEGSGGLGICKCNEYETCLVCINGGAGLR